MARRRGAGVVWAGGAVVALALLARPGDSSAQVCGASGCRAAEPASGLVATPHTRLASTGYLPYGVGAGPRWFGKTSGAGSTGETLTGAGGFCIVIGALVAIVGGAIALANPSSQPASLVAFGVGGSVLALGIGLEVLAFVENVRHGISRRGSFAPSFALAPAEHGLGATLALSVRF